MPAFQGRIELGPTSKCHLLAAHIFTRRSDIAKTLDRDGLEAV
jgi:hypothetical protein